MKRTPDAQEITSGPKNGVMLSLILLGIFILLSFLSEARGPGSICLIYSTTGIPCPTCGMTRSYLSLLQGDISRAFWFHPLFPLAPVLLYTLFTRKKKMVYGLLFIFTLVYVYRMFLYFPHIEPFLFNRLSLWGRIITILGKVF